MTSSLDEITRKRKEIKMAFVNGLISFDDAVSNIVETGISFDAAVDGVRGAAYWASLSEAEKEEQMREAWRLAR